MINKKQKKTPHYDYMFLIIIHTTMTRPLLVRSTAHRRYREIKF